MRDGPGFDPSGMHAETTAWTEVCGNMCFDCENFFVALDLNAGDKNVGIF